MLVTGGDLGFPYLVLVVVVLFAPVIGFVIRSKWRRAAARAEEIRRLLVLASEEAARAELEASAGYSYSYSDYVAPAPAVVAAAPVSSSMPVSSLKPQYQCAVCFCPTTTRCAKCKAVRYCSGKCQIIHWRQGHKDECRPFVTIPYDDDVGGSSGAKVFNQDDNDNYVDGVQKAESVERSAKEPAFSHSSHLESLHQKNDEGFEYVSRGKGTNSSLKSTVRVAYEGSSASSVCSDSSVDVSASTSSVSDYSSGFSSVNLPANDFETKTYSDHPSLVNCVDSLTGSGKLNHDEPYYNDGHSQSGKLGTPGRALDPYRDPSFPDASTGSAGFWEGTIQSKRSRIDMLNDAGWPDSGEAASCNITDSQSSLSFSFERVKRAVPSINEQGSNANSMMSHVVAPTTLGIKKLTHEEATSLNELREDATTRTPTSVIPEMSKQMDSKNGTYSRMSMSKEVKFVPSDSGVTSARLGSAPGGHSTGEDAKTVRTLPPSNHDRLNSANNISSSSTSHVPKSLDVGSLSSNISNTHLSSCTRKCTAQSVRSSKVDESREVAVCSSQMAERSQGSMNGLKTSMLKVVDQLKTPKLSRHHPLGAGSEMVALHGLKGLFSYELFVKLYNSKKVELLPCGLMNCGNSCYANAVLQCLAFTPPLTAYLLQGLHSKTCEKKEWCFTCEFESLIRKAKDGNSPLSPIRILSQVQNIGSHLGNGREEDAHEFLRYAIDTMQSVCLKEAEVNGSGHAEEETTLVGLTFGGYLRSKIKCMKCGGKSERHERMMDLTVEIEGDIRTLEEALNKFTSTEILDGDNKYQCSRCKSYEKAKKKLSVLEAPNVLTIALKRFQLGKFGKLNKSIQFPEILDMAPYVSGTSDKSPVYRLYGMVVHVDIMNAAFSGHYVCYVKNVQNKWFMIDDSTVKEVELYNVLMKGAYMLLYARCSPRAPRAIRNSLIPRDPRKAKNTVIRSRSYSTESWDFSRTNHLNDHLSSQPFHRISDEDSSSDHSSSLFSESRSCSTESSNRDSSSTEEYFDHIFGDMERDWNSSHWRNSSDSDTSSSSSPSPLYSRHSPLADSNRYASGYHETIGSKMDHQAEYGVDGHGLWSRARSRSSKEVGSLESSSVLGSDKTRDCKKLGCSSSCREINSDRLGGWVNPLENVKSGVSYRRSTRGRSD